jgi:hypothetical protein
MGTLTPLQSYLAECLALLFVKASLFRSYSDLNFGFDNGNTEMFFATQNSREIREFAHAKHSEFCKNLGLTAVPIKGMCGACF